MTRTLEVVFAATLACASLHAQTPVPMRTAPRDVGAIVKKSPVIEEMRTALRDLITYEEKYWAVHGSYTTDGSALGIYPASKGQPLVQVIFAGSRGWTGMATDQSLKGKSCVVYVGNEQELPGGLPKTMAAGIVATGEGVPTCDQP
jgi:hypothetical protein